ncbi:hypothetical protein Catovirus_1_1002 [Catovirus CTV1]|uniref:Uncharacterized protein n=1 Tax=Catovirus CTV1 TaxID=1977631 RepID=A0A1V0SB72_9VIRU|nr:hypothetical protein Catovirus_1_1002 [Catovirus CTV1]
MDIIDHLFFCFDDVQLLLKSSNYNDELKHYNEILCDFFGIKPKIKLEETFNFFSHKTFVNMILSLILDKKYEIILCPLNKKMMPHSSYRNFVNKFESFADRNYYTHYEFQLFEKLLLNLKKNKRVKICSLASLIGSISFGNLVFLEKKCPKLFNYVYNVVDCPHTITYLNLSDAMTRFHNYNVVFYLLKKMNKKKSIKLGKDRIIIDYIEKIYSDYQSFDKIKDELCNLIEKKIITAIEFKEFLISDDMNSFLSHNKCALSLMNLLGIEPQHLNFVLMWINGFDKIYLNVNSLEIQETKVPVKSLMMFTIKKFELLQFINSKKLANKLVFDFGVYKFFTHLVCKHRNYKQLELCYFDMLLDLFGKSLIDSKYNITDDLICFTDNAIQSITDNDIVDKKLFPFWIFDIVIRHFIKLEKTDVLSSLLSSSLPEFVTSIVKKTLDKYTQTRLNKDPTKNGFTDLFIYFQKY